MTFHAEVAAAATVILVAIIITAIRIDAIGRIRRAIRERRARRHETNGVGRTVKKINLQLDRMETKQDIHAEQLAQLADDFDDMEEHVNEGFRTVALLHATDPSVDNDVLRRRLGIDEMDDDLFTRSASTQGDDVEEEEESADGFGE